MDGINAPAPPPLDTTKSELHHHHHHHHQELSAALLPSNHIAVDPTISQPPFTSTHPIPAAPALTLPPLAPYPSLTSDALVDPSLPPGAVLDHRPHPAPPLPQQLPTPALAVSASAPLDPHPPLSVFPPSVSAPPTLPGAPAPPAEAPAPKKTPRKKSSVPSQTATPLPPPPSTVRRLTDFEKGQIAALWDEYHSITKIQQRVPRPYNTIKSFVDRWTSRGGEHRNVRASGRPLKVKGEERRRLQMRAREMGWDGQGRGGRERWKGWEELKKEVPGISLRTLKRVVAGVYDDVEVERANGEVPV